MSKFTSFGEIYLVHQQILSKKLPNFINSQLGTRSATAVYKYSDLVLSRCCTAFCGGDNAEDINYLKDTLQHLKHYKRPYADTILNMEQQISTPAEVLYSENGSENKLNINARMNNFLQHTALYLKMLSPDVTDYCMDFDHQFIPTQTYDSTYSYKNKRGCFSGIASINNIPVYIENRNGNCQVQFNQL